VKEYYEIEFAHTKPKLSPFAGKKYIGGLFFRMVDFIAIIIKWLQTLPKRC